MGNLRRLIKTYEPVCSRKPGPCGSTLLCRALDTLVRIVGFRLDDMVSGIGTHATSWLACRGADIVPGHHNVFTTMFAELPSND